MQCYNSTDFATIYLDLYYTNSYTFPFLMCERQKEQQIYLT